MARRCDYCGVITHGGPYCSSACKRRDAKDAERWRRKKERKKAGRN